MGQGVALRRGSGGYRLWGLIRVWELVEPLPKPPDMRGKQGVLVPRIGPLTQRGQGRHQLCPGCPPLGAGSGGMVLQSPRVRGWQTEGVGASLPPCPHPRKKLCMESLCVYREGLLPAEEALSAAVVIVPRSLRRACRARCSRAHKARLSLRVKPWPCSFRCGHRGALLPPTAVSLPMGPAVTG